MHRTQRGRWTIAVILLIAITAFASGWWLGRGRTGPGSFVGPARPIFASATDSTSDLAVATGIIADQVEGFFALDGLTGDLQCLVFNPQSQNFNAVFRRNVLADLQLDATKNPRFLVTTGNVESWRRGTLYVGASFVYVTEATTGRFAAYAVPWRRDLYASGRPQQGELLLVYAGAVRTAVVRD